MKTLLVTISLLSSLQALASGCDFYGSVREIRSNTLVSDEYVFNNYDIVSKTDLVIQLKDKKTNQIYSLDWSQTQKVDSNIRTEPRLQKRDLLYVEGNGCSTLVRCVTGQLTLTYIDEKTHKAYTFSYPQIREASQDILDVTTKNLLPVFGNLKLDTKAYGENDLDIHPAQCGLGGW